MIAKVNLEVATNMIFKVDNGDEKTPGTDVIETLENGLLKDWKTVFDSLGVACDAALLPKLSNIISTVDPSISSLPTHNFETEKVPVPGLSEKEGSSIESGLNMTIGAGDDEITAVEKVFDMSAPEPLKSILDRGKLKYGVFLSISEKTLLDSEMPELAPFRRRSLTTSLTPRLRKVGVDGSSRVNCKVKRKAEEPMIISKRICSDIESFLEEKTVTQ